jgi:GxxExxY protein
VEQVVVVVVVEVLHDYNNNNNNNNNKKTLHKTKTLAKLFYFFKSSTTTTTTTNIIIIMETTNRIVQIAAKIMEDLGAGYSESIYKNAMHRQIARIDCTCITEKNIPVLYRGDLIGVCRADIVTESHVIEVKAVRKMPTNVEKQVSKYVKHLIELDGKIRKGLVINFNQESETIETIIEPDEFQKNTDKNDDNNNISLPIIIIAKEEEEEEDHHHHHHPTAKRRKITPVADTTTTTTTTTEAGDE